jgi:hypothetical protein
MRPPWSAAGLALLLLLSLGAPGGGATATAPASSSCPISGTAGPSLGALSGSGGALAAHSLDPRAVPNRGFAMNLTMFLMPSPVPKNASFLVLSEEVVGSTVLAMGLVAISTLGPYPLPFWAVLDNKTGALVTCGVGNYSPTPGTPLDFRAEETNGTTWSVTMNGSPFGGSSAIALNASEATWTGGIAVVSLAAYNQTAWVPGMVELPQALTVLTRIPYYTPGTVEAFWTGRNTTAWGEAGNAQNASLPIGSLQIGSRLAFIPNGTVLWTRPPPVAANVTVHASPSTLTGGATTDLSSRVLRDGSPLSGLPIEWNSSGGGTFGPSTPTDALGWSNTTFLAPVLPAGGSVEITATVTSTAYIGQGSTTLAITPSAAIQVDLTATAVPSSGPPGGNVTITLTGREATGPSPGAPASQLRVSVGISPAAGGISPGSPWTTNSSGQARGSLLLPPDAPMVELVFRVISPGYEGIAYLNITINAAPSSPGAAGLTGPEWDLVGVGVALVLATLLVVAYRRRRKARTPPGPSSAVGVPAVCPGCGAPVPSPAPRFCPSCGVPLPGTRETRPPGR